LFRDDFICAAGRVSRRKLDRIKTSPYQQALLRRGITTKVDAEDERVPVLQQAMEYAGAMGTMVFNEVAYINGQTESGLGRAINGVEREVTRVDDAVVEHMMLIAEVQGDVENLITRDRRRINVEDALQTQVTGLHHLVSQLLRWVTALEGRQEHPIEVEDDLEEEEEESEEDEEMDPILVPGPSVVGRLVPIEEDLVEETDSEIEEGLVIEIAAMDPAPAYTE